MYGTITFGPGTTVFGWHVRRHSAHTCASSPYSATYFWVAICASPRVPPLYAMLGSLRNAVIAVWSVMPHCSIDARMAAT